MKETLGAVFAWAAMVVVALAVLFAIQGTDFFVYRIFAPKYEAVRHQTFKQSQAYNDGVAQEVVQAHLDYMRAKTDSERGAIVSIVRHQLASYDTDNLPPDCRRWASEIKEGKL